MQPAYRLRGETLETVLHTIFNQRMQPPFFTKSHGTPYPSVYNIGVQLPIQPDDEYGPVSKIGSKPFWVVYTLEPEKRRHADDEARAKLAYTPPAELMWRATPVEFDVLYHPGEETRQKLTAYQHVMTNILREQGGRREFIGGVKSFIGSLSDIFTNTFLPSRTETEHHADRTYTPHKQENTGTKPEYPSQEMQKAGLSSEQTERLLEKEALSPPYRTERIHKL